jgi:hypothetical protein
MNSGIRAAMAAALVSMVALAATPALAQRVFVAAQGSDANPCTFAMPCRTFQHAHNVVAAGGEIDVLDPAGYGALTINKPISIQGHGFAGISVSAGNTGITVTAGMNDAISLNGLLVEGSGVGNFGFIVNSGKSLVIENCVVRNFAVHGLLFLSSAPVSQSLSVSGSYFAENATTGILVQQTSNGAASVTVARTAFYGGGTGMDINGAPGSGVVNAAVTDSVAANMTGTGFLVRSTSGHSVANLALTRVSVSGNATGIDALGTNATLRIGQSTVTANAFGYQAVSGGVVFSYGDNYIDGNTGNSGTLSSAATQ